ncbi:MAG: class I SAM-dependent methyltransferase [Bacteroidota bacterium]
MHEFDHNLLQCPITKEHLTLISQNDIAALVEGHRFEQAFINESKTFLYPVVQEIIQLLPYYAIPIVRSDTAHQAMHFDKDRVFRYYNEIQYEQVAENTIYADARKFLDFRAVSRDYIQNSLRKARAYIKPAGTYFLDIASGPIGLPAYIGLSEGYEYRVCVDLSFNALLEAKNNLKQQKGIFICGDISNIPISTNRCDVAVSHHTLYHLPKAQQARAVHELYRVTKVGGRVAIIYSWFYHSWLMNISLFPLQLYRILRHLAGKLYVRLFPQKARLYFYPHSPRWFRNLGYGGQLNIYCWRSLNKQFLEVFIHDNALGRKILAQVERLEKKYPKRMGILGDYPIITIDKVKEK